jgi:hypothetical protein
MLEQRLLFMRLSLGFGWCLEGSAPLDYGEEGGEDKDEQGLKDRLRGRKRKRLDVFGEREKNEGKEKENKEAKMREAKEKGKGNEIPERGNADEKSAVGDGVGEVGRLCIWCVKM